MAATIKDYDVDGFELTFDAQVTDVERTAYITYFPNVDNVIESRLHCTSCQQHLGSAPAIENKICTHPVMRTAQCRRCYTFYNSGEFERGEDGSELYCRWCGQGGEVYCCAKCIFVFCRKCITANLSRSVITDITSNDNWECFRCQPEIVWPLRARHWACMNYMEKRKAKILNDFVDDEEIYERMNLDTSSCCSKRSKSRAAKQAITAAYAGVATNIPEAQPKPNLKRRRTHKSEDTSSEMSSTKPSKSSVDTTTKGNKQPTSPKTASTSRKAPSGKQPDADMVCCTPDIMELLQGGNGDVGENSSDTSSAHSANAIAEAQVAAITRRHPRPSTKRLRGDFVVSQTDVQMRQPTANQPAQSVAMHMREVVAATGTGAAPVFYTINGYRIDLNTAARQESFRLPNGKFIQVKKQPTGTGLQHQQQSKQQQSKQPPNKQQLSQPVANNRVAQPVPSITHEMRLSSVPNSNTRTMSTAPNLHVLPRMPTPSFQGIPGSSAALAASGNFVTSKQPPPIRYSMTNNALRSPTTSIISAAAKRAAANTIIRAAGAQPLYQVSQITPMQRNTGRAITTLPSSIPSLRPTAMNHQQLQQLHLAQQQQLLAAMPSTSVMRFPNATRTTQRSNANNVSAMTGLPVTTTVLTAPHPSAVAAQTTQRQPVFARTQYPKTPVGDARTHFENHIISAQEVCHHIIGKLNTLMKSNAYKTANSFADVKELNVHLSYLYRYTMGRFQTLADKSQEDVAELDRKTTDAIQAADRQAQYVNDEDDVHVVEPSIDQIEIDESTDDENESKKEKRSPKKRLEIAREFLATSLRTCDQQRSNVSQAAVAAADIFELPLPPLLDEFLPQVQQIDVTSLAAPKPTTSTATSQSEEIEITNDPKLKARIEIKLQRVDTLLQRYLKDSHQALPQHQKIVVSAADGKDNNDVDVSAMLVELAQMAENCNSKADLSQIEPAGCDESMTDNEDAVNALEMLEKIPASSEVANVFNTVPDVDVAAMIDELSKMADSCNGDVGELCAATATPEAGKENDSDAMETEVAPSEQDVDDVQGSDQSESNVTQHLNEASTVRLERTDDANGGNDVDTDVLALADTIDSIADESANNKIYERKAIDPNEVKQTTSETECPVVGGDKSEIVVKPSVAVTASAIAANKSDIIAARSTEMKSFGTDAESIKAKVVTDATKANGSNSATNDLADNISKTQVDTETVADDSKTAYETKELFVNEMRQPTEKSNTEKPPQQNSNVASESSIDITASKFSDSTCIEPSLPDIVTKSNPDGGSLQSKETNSNPDAGTLQSKETKSDADFTGSALDLNDSSIIEFESIEPSVVDLLSDSDNVNSSFDVTNTADNDLVSILAMSDREDSFRNGIVGSGANDATENADSRPNIEDVIAAIHGELENISSPDDFDSLNRNGGGGAGSDEGELA